MTPLTCGRAAIRREQRVDLARAPPGCATGARRVEHDRSRVALARREALLQQVDRPLRAGAAGPLVVAVVGRADRLRRSRWRRSARRPSRRSRSAGGRCTISQALSSRSTSAGWTSERSAARTLAQVRVMPFHFGSIGHRDGNNRRAPAAARRRAAQPRPDHRRPPMRRSPSRASTSRWRRSRAAPASGRRRSTAASRASSCCCARSSTRASPSSSRRSRRRRRRRSWEGLLAGMRAVLDAQARNMAFVEVLAQAGELSELKTRARERVFAPLCELIARAQAAGRCAATSTRRSCRC